MLLASETKDFRLLAHLLRTLQHAGDILLASRMLAQYTEHYWTCAAPQNMAHKKRFAAQVIKRFESAVQDFAGMLRQYSAMLCWESWQNWHSAGRRTTRLSWQRRQTIYFPCFSARFVM